MSKLCIDIELLPTGEIRISREQRDECREFLLQLLKKITDKKSITEIKDFLEGSNDYDLILGNKILCG